MTKRTVIVTSLLAVATLSLPFAALAAKSPAAEKAVCIEALVPNAPWILDANNRFAGMTEYGFKLVTEAQKGLIEADKIGKYLLQEMDAFLFALRMGQIGRWNIWMYGAPGGAKTKFVTTMLPDVWMKQVHELMNEVPLIGGQTLKGAEEGREEINTKGTLIEARYGVIDEGQNANPAVLTATNSVVNSGERRVYIGGKMVKAEHLRMLVFACNGNLPEILDSFVDKGQGMSGPAFLNRFEFKFRVPNWLEADSQKRLDELEERRRELKSLARSNPKLLEDLAFQTPADIDAQNIEDFAFATFGISEELGLIVREFVEELRNKTSAAIKDSEKAHQEDQITNPYVLTPSADFTTRLRTQLTNMIKVSAALDYLRSPMGSPERMKKLKGKITLGPRSAWRLWAVLTTVGPNRVIYDPAKNTIHFNVKVVGNGKILAPSLESEMARAKNNKEQLEVKYVKDEQERFLESLRNHWKKLQQAFEDVARYTEMDPEDMTGDDFEFSLAALGGTDVMQVQKVETK